jgi:hypothetical protein
LHTTLDIPSLSAGTNSWLNIQPLLRHSFLHVSEHVVHLNETVGRQAREIAFLHEQNAANVKSMSEHFGAAMRNVEEKHDRQMEDMKALVFTLERKVKEMEGSSEMREVALRASINEIACKHDSGSTSSTILADRIVKLESNILGVSMRMDGLSDVVDGHLFNRKDGGRGSSSGASSSTNDNKNVLQLISDVSKIRDELSFKCDGALIKNVLENKANKQSVADALHSKANKKTVAKELTEIKTFINTQFGNLKKQVNSVQTTNGLPVSKISSTLMTVAKEVREGVAESKDMMQSLEQRLERVEKANHVGGISSNAGGNGGGGYGMGEMGYGVGGAVQEQNNILRNSVNELENRIQEIKMSVGGFK